MLNIKGEDFHYCACLILTLNISVIHSSFSITLFLLLMSLILQSSLSWEACGFSSIKASILTTPKTLNLQTRLRPNKRQLEWFLSLGCLWFYSVLWQDSQHRSLYDSKPRQNTIKTLKSILKSFCIFPQDYSGYDTWLWRNIYLEFVDKYQDPKTRMEGMHERMKKWEWEKIMLNNLTNWFLISYVIVFVAGDILLSAIFNCNQYSCQ